MGGRDFPERKGRCAARKKGSVPGMKVIVNDSSSLGIVDGTTTALRGFKVSCRVAVVSTRHVPSIFFS